MDSFDYTSLNARTIDRWIEEGWEWGVPISHEEFEKVGQGVWKILLTPTKPVPHAVEMLKWQRDNLIPTARFFHMSEEERIGKKQIGILSYNDYPEYTDEYAKVVEACAKKAKK